MTKQNDLVFCPQSGESLAFFSSFRQLIHVPAVNRKLMEPARDTRIEIPPIDFADLQPYPTTNFFFELSDLLSKSIGISEEVYTDTLGITVTITADCYNKKGN